MVRISFPKSYRAGESVKPGTLTVTVGGRSITLDPMDERQKFDANKRDMEEMLAKIKA
jgi:hypothetical protein